MINRESFCNEGSVCSGKHMHNTVSPIQNPSSGSYAGSTFDVRKCVRDTYTYYEQCCYKKGTIDKLSKAVVSQSAAGKFLC